MEVTKKILNEEGLHARPAGVLAKAASGFQSKIEVVFNGRSVNAKSAMSLMTMGLTHNCEITVKADGADAEAALAHIAKLIDHKFDTAGLN